MKHFPKFAHYPAYIARLILILVHVPVMIFALMAHIIGALFQFVGTVGAGVAVLVGGNFQTLVDSIVMGVVTILGDVAAVYSGVSSGNVTSSVANVVKTADDAEKLVPEVKAAAVDIALAEDTVRTLANGDLQHTSIGGHA